MRGRRSSEGLARSLLVIAGVDGCKDKWIAVVELNSGHTEVLEPCTFDKLYEDRSLDLIVIDIPIGLPEKGYRRADLVAKRFLRHRHVCVFPAPTRLILDCSYREQASDRCVEVGDKRVNVFQWAIVPKVKCIDLALRQHKNPQDRFREGHPEVSFALLNQKTPLSSKKKKAGGDRRLGLLREHFSDIQTNSPHLEDILDAYALLWTARRVRAGQECRFPKKSQIDPFGLRMEISA
jgi:predicted RNase H-like nuclease